MVKEKFDRSKPHCHVGSIGPRNKDMNKIEKILRKNHRFDDSNLVLSMTNVSKAMQFSQDVHNLNEQLVLALNNIRKLNGNGAMFGFQNKLISEALEKVKTYETI